MGEFDLSKYPQERAEPDYEARIKRKAFAISSEHGAKYEAIQARTNRDFSQHIVSLIEAEIDRVFGTE